MTQRDTALIKEPIFSKTTDSRGLKQTALFGLFFALFTTSITLTLALIAAYGLSPFLALLTLPSLYLFTLAAHQADSPSARTTITTPIFMPRPAYLVHP